MTRTKWTLNELDEFDVACEDQRVTEYAKGYRKGLEDGGR